MNEKDYHQPLPRDNVRTPEQAVQKIRYADHEHLYFFKGGKQIRRFKGTRKKVTPESKYLFEMKDTTVVHNHPGGLPFSREDVEAIIRYDAYKLILITQDYFHSIQRPDIGWLVDFDSTFSIKQLHRCEVMAKEIVDKMISRFEITSIEGEVAINHYIWVLFFDINNIRYVRRPFEEI